MQSTVQELDLGVWLGLARGQAMPPETSLRSAYRLRTDPLFSGTLFAVPNSRPLTLNAA